jgi:hypothetical protein
VPFSSVRGFYDPSVNFELEFDVNMAEEENAGAEITQYPEQQATEIQVVSVEDPSAEPKPAGTASVVSLDSFRKKS